MRRRSLWFTLLILIVAVGVLCGTLGYFLKQDPPYYTTNDDDENDPLVAAVVITRFGDLKNDIRSKGDWGATFSAQELNAFLREHLSDGESLSDILPDNIHSPRVAIEGDRIKIAARWQSKLHESLSTVLSLELKVWLVNKQINTVAVEIVGVWAGGIPIGSQSWLDRISEAARESNVDVTWYRHDGHPVGVFRFYADQVVPTTQIRTIHVADGKVTMAGRSLIDPGLPASVDGRPPTP